MSRKLQLPRRKTKIPVAKDPHDALDQVSVQDDARTKEPGNASSEEDPIAKKRNMGWPEHGQSFAHAFAKSPDSKGWNCSCWEKPFDGPLADDLYVAYARWDNRLKRWIPVCKADHDFGTPPWYYRYGGIETMESAASWILGGITLIVIIALFATSGSGGGMHDHHYYRDDDYFYGGALWPAVAVTGGLLLLMCTCAGCATWYVGRDEKWDYYHKMSSSSRDPA